jgi:hypothetical protein
MLHNAPDFEIPHSDRVDENGSLGSLNFGANGCPLSPKMNELRMRHKAKNKQGGNFAPVENVYKV